MKRPRTTSFVATPPSPAAPATPEPLPPAQSPVFRETAGIMAALVAVLDAVETAPRSGPAVKAYQSAMRRQGEAAIAVGGREAMEAVVRQIAETDPAKAAARTTIVRAAWAGLTE